MFNTLFKHGKFKALVCPVICSIFLLSCSDEDQISSTNSIVKLDLEHKTESKKVINSSTQSLNRYSSNLRQLTQVGFDFDPEARMLDVTLRDENSDMFLKIRDVETGFISPLLPYDGVSNSRFDIVNIILAEYSRNGIGIPIQDSNDSYANIEYSPDLFNDDGEYIFKDGKYNPNPGVLPKRINLVNNCLRPGLFEMGANDAVGEMYHSWIELDQELYFSILSAETGMDQSVIPSDFDNPIHFDKVKLEINQLRNLNEKVGTYPVQYHKEKEIGSYSSQDSRRKVQRKFYTIMRHGETIEVSRQEELADGDMFSMFSFEEPGIYNPIKKNDLEFSRQWKTAEVSKVDPLTRYSTEQQFLPSEYIEVSLYNDDRTKGLIIGNIPMSLLSFKNDFVIPSFGAGVLLASEPIERRVLRKTSGPKPSFAYLLELEGSDAFIKNNHLTGLEQIYLRPVKKEDGIYLRCTIVSYERITDLLEFEILIPELESEFISNDASYSPPLFETYQDDNTL